ncbi:MAG: DUF3365 domain-containing protein [gamma proteobacterium symbiont of Lucinoma myriamae]|nr:DUF3365 domain-containing protein [gamma proteobacterium symbiont of Lucinoma myriamae]MCU7818645.1 DUF3365 domain-containing protein [gamma proteobacterium symbiont of Lucinoma myriamae]MCU7831918.1 DUF3365 domain-containing protein [gamma proteobacterium symbiont of Lucinoma myriamae]
MRLQSKIFIITAIIFALHFVVNTYLGQRQIREDVIANIKENARTIRGMLMSYRRVYQEIFIDHDIPINDVTIKFLPAHAISRISQGFTQWVDNGLTFNTVSDRPRNPINQADKVELDAIQFFRANQDIKERFVPYQTASNEDYYHFSQPIIIKPRCMKCHGEKDAAPASIQRRYDTAYNYKIGDLRGLMSIKLPAEIIEQRSSELFQRNLLIHSLGMFFTFLLIALLLNRTVLSRIRGLQLGSEKLALGDYKTRIKLSGNDELTQMGYAFNHMAQTISQREQQLIKQKSLYYALSQTNKSIVKLDSTEKLLNKICHIATSQNNIILAWFGMADSQQSALIPLASAGQTNGYLQSINLSLQIDSPHRLSPVNRAFYLRETSINNHYLSDPDMAFTHDDAEKAGVQSVASFPINKNDHIIGVFSVYSDQENYFTDDIVNLLQEISHDVEYAIQHYDLKKQHFEAQKQLERSSNELTELNDLMSMLLESTGEGIFGVDKNGCTFVNHAAQKMFGYSLAELYP